MAELIFSKERPKLFSEIYGHDRTKKELIKRSKDDNIPTVILLTGITGIGKNTTERVISKSILCQSKDKEGNPCNICEYCTTVDNEKSSTYYTVHNASNIGIDEMRIIEEIAMVKSFSGSKRKVIVIDEFQELGTNQKAAKNLLKVIERPSTHCYFILLAMDESKIPSSVINRSIHYKLKPLSMEEIATCLYSICNKMDIKIDTDEKSNVLLTIADNSYGSMRTAISYLERAIYSELWTVNELVNELDIVSNENLISSINKMFSGDGSALILKYNKDILEKLRYILGTAYKVKSGVEVESWQKNQLKGLSDISIDQLKFALESIFPLNQYSYLTQDLIDFTLMNIINSNKNTVEVPTPPKRRKLDG